MRLRRDKIKMIYDGINSFGDDAYFIELSDNKGCYFHKVGMKKTGEFIYTIKQGITGAVVMTKENGEKFIKEVKNQYPHTKLTSVKDVVGNKDGSLN